MFPGCRRVDPRSASCPVPELPRLELQFMKCLRIVLWLLLVGAGILTFRGLDAYYEKELLLKFLKRQGFSEVRVMGSHLHRGLFWIQHSHWRLAAGKGNENTQEHHEFDADIFSRMPGDFGDSGKMEASWRERFEGKDFYCCRSGGYIYVGIYHF